MHFVAALLTFSLAAASTGCSHIDTGDPGSFAGAPGR